LRQFLIIPGLPIGVGLALCKRLLEEDEELHVCLACRNVGKAEAVRAALLASHPTAEVSVVQVDVSNVQSVIRAARELKQRGEENLKRHGCSVRAYTEEIWTE
uniref:Uncharacterized protein n=1 Tax=Ursus maritimus TaxID=29073 RepID=A0A452T3T2_URSMA